MWRVILWQSNTKCEEWQCKYDVFILQDVVTYFWFSRHAWSMGWRLVNVRNVPCFHKDIGIEKDALFEMYLYTIRGEYYQSKSHTFTTVIGLYLCVCVCVLIRSLEFINGGGKEGNFDCWRVVIVLLQIKY